MSTEDATVPAVDETGLGEDAFEVPEADRLFAPPTPEEAEHALRDLVWGEHFVCTRMAAARGNSTMYLYSLREAAAFLLDGNSGSASLGSSGSFAWVEFDRFVAWLRDVLGDTAFANALEERRGGCETYNDKIEVLRQLLDLRMTQYRPYLPSDEGEGAGDEGADEDENEEEQA